MGRRRGWAALAGGVSTSRCNDAGGRGAVRRRGLPPLVLGLALERLHRLEAALAVVELLLADVLLGRGGGLGLLLRPRLLLTIRLRHAVPLEEALLLLLLVTVRHPHVHPRLHHGGLRF